MGKSLFTMVFLISIGITMAQENEQNVETGDILVLGTTSGPKYRHIDFPRKNIIIKRGAIADFKSLVGEKLIIADMGTDENGNVEVILKRKNGLNFFRFYPKVTANLEKALTNGELKTSKKKKLDSIAK